MVALDFRLNNRRGILGGASPDELDSAGERMLAVDLRLKSRRGMLGVSCDEGDGGEEEVSSEEDARKVALDFRRKSCILSTKGWVTVIKQINDLQCYEQTRFKIQESSLNWNGDERETQ
jgi:hypothetical protein